jgi:ribosomal protein S18 acetylase RimI-like enzyme
MTEEYKIRPFSIRRDIDAIAELVSVAFAEDLAIEGTNFKTELTMIKKMVPIVGILSHVSPTFQHIFDGFVAEDQGKMVALVNISRSGPKSKRWLIGNVATHPDYRRRGLARKLVDKAIEHARSNGADTCLLEVRATNTPAYTLYSSQGFTHYDSTIQLKLEDLPVVSALPINGYRKRNMKIGEWKARFELACKATPQEVQDFLPENEEEFRVPPLIQLLDPILKRVQKMDAFRWAIEKDGALVATLSVTARNVTGVVHRISLRILPGHSEALAKSLINLALETLQPYPRQNINTTVRASDQPILEAFKGYGFVEYEEAHHLGLKLK